MSHQPTAETLRQLRPVEPDWIPEPAGPRPVLRRLAEVDPTPVDWLWYGYLARRKLHVLDGDPGLGKTTVSLDLAARVTTGAAWPDGQPGQEPGGVVIMTTEDELGDTIRPRLDAAGADVDRVVALSDIEYDDHEGTHERSPVLPDDIDHIVAAIEAVNASLVIMDPLMGFLASRIDPHKDASIRKALGPLTKAAAQSGAAVIMIRHLNKGDSTNALYRGGGSIGIVSAARLGLAVARDPDNPDGVIFASVKNNLSPRADSLAFHLEETDNDRARIAWDGPTGHTADELLGGQSGSMASTSQDHAAAWLADYLAEHGETPRQQVLTDAEAARIPVRTLRRPATLAKAGAISERRGFPATATWRLKSDHAADVGPTGPTGPTGPAGTDSPATLESDSGKDVS